MENKDNRNLEEEMDTASEAKAGEETAEAPSIRATRMNQSIMKQPSAWTN